MMMRYLWRATFSVALGMGMVWANGARAITSTYVQGNSGRSWLDSANWADGDIGPSPPTVGGGTVPTNAGDIAILQQKVTSGTQGSGQTVQISLGGGSPTIGTLTVRNTDNAYTTAIVSGTLNFDNGANPSVFNEDTGSVIPTTNSSRTRVNVPVNIAGDFVINQNHNLDFNTATEFVQSINQPALATFTKNGLGNLQLAYGGALGANDGVQGNVLINQGAIRLINGTGSTNTVFSKATGMTVADGAQFQLGNGITSFNLGPGAELQLNGIGKSSGAFSEGALRFEQSAGLRFVVDFNSPIRLQTQSRVYVTAADTTAIIHEEIRGDGPAGLNKGGGGLLKLATDSLNGNTYAGATNVSNGALAVNNSQATASGVGTGDVNINSGGLLGGTGTIGTLADESNVVVTEGTLSPGDLTIDSSSGALVESAGTLTVHGGLNLSATSALNMNIEATADQIIASGPIDLGDATLNLSLGSFIPDGLQSFTLISNTGVGSVQNDFGVVNVNGVPAGGPDLDLNGSIYHLTYAGGTGGNDVVLLPGSSPGGVPGDYNNNGTVDAADYVLWRKGAELANEIDNPGVVDAQDYVVWKQHFGTTGGGGGHAPVPEPVSSTLFLLSSCGLLFIRRR